MTNRSDAPVVMATTISPVLEYENNGEPQVLCLIFEEQDNKSPERARGHFCTCQVKGDNVSVVIALFSSFPNEI